MTELKWEISREETRSRRARIFRACFKLGVIFGIGWGFVILNICSDDITYCGAGSYLQSLRDLLPWALGAFMLPSAVIAMAFFINKLYPYAQRKYVLSRDFFSVSKGFRSKMYHWEEFSTFYTFRFTRINQKIPTSDVQAEGLALERNIKDISGTRFLLRKKPAIFKFIKNFVVIYSEPDNHESVLKYLKTRLPEGNLDEFTDSGLVISKFK